MRLLWLSLGLAVLLLLPFLAFGETFTAWFTGTAAIEWLRRWGAFGSLAVVALLISDLVLPVPATGVMSAAGYLYGTLAGGAMSALGSFLSGLLAYGLCRRWGRPFAERLAGPADLARGERLFAHQGPWLVALSRCLPLLPEVTSCLAGVTRMPFTRFALALACGSLPMGFIYASIGAAGQENPGFALGLSIAVPAILYTGVQLWLRKRDLQ